MSKHIKIARIVIPDLISQLLEGLHTAWVNDGFRLRDCCRSVDPTRITEATELAESWLALVGWTGEDFMAGKVSAIQLLWADIVALINNPSDL